jgi:hypothetical protein
MPAPTPDKIILPLDTGNTGKQVRTQIRQIAGNPYHEHFFIPISQRSVLGAYKASSGTLTVPAGVHNGTTTGFLWFYNPVGSAIKMAVKRISWNVQIIVLAVDLLGGELRFSRFTFTGVGSAGLLTPASRDSTDAAAVGNLRTASTGMTCTLGATINGTQYPTMGLATGGAGVWPGAINELIPDKEQDEIILRAGEGIVIWHAIAVTTANRRLFVNFAWEEFE